MASATIASGVRPIRPRITSRLAGSRNSCATRSIEHERQAAAVQRDGEKYLVERAVEKGRADSDHGVQGADRKTCGAGDGVLLGDPGQHSGALAMWTDEDLAAPARFFVCEQVNVLRAKEVGELVPEIDADLRGTSRAGSAAPAPHAARPRWRTRRSPRPSRLRSPPARSRAG